MSNAEVETAMQNAMDGVATGQLTAEEACARIQQVQDKVLAE
jgi:hypothetical protein